MKHQGDTTESRPAARKFSARNLRGILIPFTTPFNAEEGVDAHALRSNIERWNEAGIKGYVALGSTGERVHLDDRECLEVIEAARVRVPDHLALIVGAGQASTRVTIDEARRFSAAGADALLVITPHFYRRAMTHEALVNHYLAVADASPVPVVLYSMPDLTGISIAPETVVLLSEHENIIGIKDSSADIINLAETLRLVPEGFAVLTGNGPLLYAALSAGAQGAILAVGCVAARLARAIYAAVEAADYERARDLQQRLTPLARAVTTRYGISGLKAALDMLGYKGGPVRAPLQSPNEEARREIAHLLEEAAWSEEEKTEDGESRLAGARTL
ncbi:MAG: dihydrodipicolinate synthase family protein [Acidobacteria bacterium]|nr:dihydrodipicolinate synthase family protein [Acidobacteriota bacterium]